MKAFCKKNYPSLVDHYHQVFFSGKTYDMKIYDNDKGFLYKISNELGEFDLFTPDEFDDNFYDLKKMRKEKIIKINNTKNE